MTTGGTFEAILYAMRKNRDGLVLSVVVHPSDIEPALMNLPIGARVAVKWVELKDEEAKGGDASAAPRHRAAIAHPHAEQSATHGESHKERRRFADLPLSQQAGMRCGEPAFAQFLKSEFTGTMRYFDNDVACAVRGICDVESRAALDSDRRAAARWRQIEEQFESWLTTQAHADTYR